MAAKKSKSGLTEAARTLGKAGGKVGGPARARSLSKSKRVAIARQGGQAKARKKGGKK